MVWFTWRQHRTEAYAGAVVLLLIIGVAIFTGLRMRMLYDQEGMAACKVLSTRCIQTVGNFNGKATSDAFGDSALYQLFLGLLLGLPLLVGMFVGASAGGRELEQGTYRFVWTQGISRGQWLIMKVSLLALTTVCAFVLLSFFLSWWSVPLINPYTTLWQFYNTQSIVLPAFALFALALGITAGVLTRKTIPAIAITLIIFVGIRLLIEVFWRPAFLPPLDYAYSLSQTNIQIPAQAWELKQKQDFVDKQGNSIPNTATSVCETSEEYGKCMDDHGFRYRIAYQPIERFWLFQTFEGSIYLLLSLGLFFFAYWWVKRKII